MDDLKAENKEFFDIDPDKTLNKDIETSESIKNLSKRSIKRRLKKKKWEETKEERRKYKKERDKIKRLEKRKIQKETDASTIKLRKDQVPSDIKVIIDCGFDDKMIDKEIVSLSSQLTRCYSDNRRCAYPIELYVTSFEGRLAERMRTVLKSQHISWRGIQFLDQSYDILYEKEGFRKEDFIYLTADSENTIYELDKSKIYIIGGLVDKNRYKNLCLDKAKSQGIYTAQLPIKDHIKMGSRKVLTVNQVLKIMHQWIEIKDWEKAFLNVIPSRKLPQSKTKNTDQQLEDLKTNSLILEDIGDLSEEAITEINE